MTDEPEQSSVSTSPYPAPTRADFPAIERRVLARWRNEGTFASSVAARLPERDWVFYDGPPFATACPITDTCSQDS